MLHKCANPSCSTPLIYLREGKIFMMEHAPGPQTAAMPENGKRVSSTRVEHFWLCGPCSNDMTLTFDRQRGLEIVRKKAVGKAPLVRRAAAS